MCCIRIPAPRVRCANEGDVGEALVESAGDDAPDRGHRSLLLLLLRLPPLLVPVLVLLLLQLLLLLLRFVVIVVAVVVVAVIGVVAV